MSSRAPLVVSTVRSTSRTPCSAYAACAWSVDPGDLLPAQVRAVATGCRPPYQEGVDPRPEIMVPLVSITAEHVQTREVIERVIAEASPRKASSSIFPWHDARAAACLHGRRRDRPSCRLLRFGTNDLTQTTWLLPRRDAESSSSRCNSIVYQSFDIIDHGGAELVRVVVEMAARSIPDMYLGVASTAATPSPSRPGERPTTTSCSPYRALYRRRCSGR